jgi:sulfide:quinone oxidoreductase
VERTTELVRGVESGEIASVAFVVPRGVTWPLPIYELALMSAERAPGAELTVVSAEDRPLEIFGGTASDDVAAMIAEAGIAFEGGARPDVPDPGTVALGGDRELRCDRVVALPRLRGPAILGLPADERGFLRTTSFGHVLGTKDVYAAGDGTSFPIKQGGVACQQADVVAQVVARRAGANVTPMGYRPTLRGVLLTGDRSRWLRHDAPRHGDETSEAASQHLWWPPSKVAGEFLAPYLGEGVAANGSGLAGRAVITTGRDGGRVEMLTLEQPAQAS